MRAARWLPAACACLLLLAAAPDEPAVVDLTTALDGSRVLVSFRLAGAFDARVQERLEAGLPTGFTFEIELARDRKRWWDAGLVSATYEVVAMYNAMTREYLVNAKQDGKLVESRTLREGGDLERALTQFTAVPAFSVPTSRLEPGQRLLVRVRAELGPTTVLGFVPATITTAWTESAKFRLPSEEP